jgi:hypothetical protein
MVFFSSLQKANRECKVSGWSNWSPCTKTCGIGERMRVRVPIEKNSTAHEHQMKIKKLYMKFNSDMKKLHGDMNYENDENEDKTSEEELSDLEILGIARINHPCSKEILVEKQACGIKSNRCQHEIFGIPRKFDYIQKALSPFIVGKTQKQIRKLKTHNRSFRDLDSMCMRIE